MLEWPGDSQRFTLGCLEGASPVSFRLHGVTARLLVLQDLRVVDGGTEVLGYQYRFSRGEEKDSWLLRWEYTRPNLGRPYPPAHVHVNGAFASGRRELRKLHIPTQHIQLELVLWHLIVEWDVRPKHENWRRVFEESQELL